MLGVESVLPAEQMLTIAAETCTVLQVCNLLKLIISLIIHCN